MKMKTFKDKMLREKQQTNIYLQKTQAPKPSMSSPNLDLRLKSKTLFNKENQQPNIPNIRVQKPTENTFGKAKLLIRQSADDLKMQMNREFNEQTSHKELPHQGKQNELKFNFLYKSMSYERSQTERNQNAFSIKHLRTQFCEEAQNTCPIIEDCEFIRSEYESSEQQANEEKLNFAKCYQRPINRPINTKNIIVHESLNYDEERSREIPTFKPNEAKNIIKYQFERNQQKRMKSEIVNNIIMNSKAEMMRSCDFQNIGSSSLRCTNHNTKKAKYRLNAELTDDEEECFYCSKCAVNLAKQGFDIEEISSLDRKMIMSRQPTREAMHSSVQINPKQSNRRDDLNHIQTRLCMLQSKVSAKLTLFTQKSEQMTRIDKGLQSRISNYDSLIQIIESMKREEIEKEEKLRKQKSLDVDLKKHELSKIMNSIRDTVVEINREKHQINGFKSKDFGFFLDSYLKKITSYEEYLTKLEQTQLSQEIATFDQNLDSQELDQQTMFRQIFDEILNKMAQSNLQAMTRMQKRPMPSKTLQKESKALNEIQSGGSSMFYCQEDENESRPPFRILFENSKPEEMECQQKALNKSFLNDSFNNENEAYQSYNQSQNQNQPQQRNVRYFKEQNYHPSFQQYK